MNNTQINELFLSNKRLNELVFELNNKVDLRLNNLEIQMTQMNNNIEKLYNHNLELLSMFHMKNNEDLFAKLQNVNNNMEKLKNLSSLVSKEFSEIQQKKNELDDNDEYKNIDLKSPDTLINLGNENTNNKNIPTDLLSSINLN